MKVGLLFMKKWNLWLWALLVVAAVIAVAVATANRQGGGRPSKDDDAPALTIKEQRADLMKFARRSRLSEPVTDREGWDGKYAWTDKDGLLHVGDLDPVFPRASVEGISLTALAAAFRDESGWKDVGDGMLTAYSANYAVQFLIPENGGDISIVNGSVFPGTGGATNLNIARSAEMRRDGSWDGNPMWFPDSGDVIKDSAYGLQMLDQDSPEAWANTGIFPSASTEKTVEAGYRDEATGRTVTATCTGVRLYEQDGKELDAETQLITEANYGHWSTVAVTEAGVLAHPADGSTIYKVDFEAGKIDALYEDVSDVELTSERLLVTCIQPGTGMVNPRPRVYTFNLAGA